MVTNAKIWSQFWGKIKLKRVQNECVHSQRICTRKESALAKNLHSRSSLTHPRGALALRAQVRVQSASASAERKCECRAQVRVQSASASAERKVHSLPTLKDEQAVSQHRKQYLAMSPAPDTSLSYSTHKLTESVNNK
jgi:hypothetical protein